MSLHVGLVLVVSPPRRPYDEATTTERFSTDIRRTLSSTTELVDYWAVAIVGVGGTSSSLCRNECQRGTSCSICNWATMISEFFKPYGIPGQIIVVQVEDDCAAIRNQLLEVMRANRHNIKIDYCISLNVGNALVFPKNDNGSWPRNPGGSHDVYDVYDVVVENSDGSYSGGVEGTLPVMFATNRGYGFVGKVGDYLDVPRQARRIRLENVSLLNHYYSSSSSFSTSPTAYERSAIRSALAYDETTTNLNMKAHYAAFAARSFTNCSKPREAIFWYKRRIALTGHGTPASGCSASAWLQVAKESALLPEASHFEIEAHANEAMRLDGTLGNIYVMAASWLATYFRKCLEWSRALEYASKALRVIEKGRQKMLDSGQVPDIHILQLENSALFEVCMAEPHCGISSTAEEPRRHIGLEACRLLLDEQELRKLAPSTIETLSLVYNQQYLQRHRKPIVTAGDARELLDKLQKKSRPAVVCLVQEWFNAPNPSRQTELYTTLVWNIENPQIDIVILICDDCEQAAPFRPASVDTQAWNSKVLCVQPVVKGRQTFRSTFMLANRILPDSSLAMIANLDISFDHSLHRLKRIRFNKLCLALLRHDCDVGPPNGARRVNDRLYTLGGIADSQDTWIFQTPLPLPDAALTKLDLDFTFGSPGCDNVCAFQLQEHGYSVVNACATIRTFHLHADNNRTPYTATRVAENAYRRRHYSTLFPECISRDAWKNPDLDNEWEIQASETAALISDIPSQKRERAFATLCRQPTLHSIRHLNNAANACK